MSVKFGISTFYPDSISGLVAWYDASSQFITRDSSNRVSGWVNRINGDTNTNLTQGTPGNQPLWTNASANLNSQPSLIFDKARVDTLASGTWSTPMPNPATWFFASRVIAIDTNGAVLNEGVGGATHSTFMLGNAWYINSGLSIGIGTYTPPNNYIVCGIFSASGKVYVNAQTPIVTGDSGAQTQSIVHLGKSGTAGYALHGEIAEVLGYNRALTQAEVNKLLSYGGNKFGITIAA